MPIRGSPVIRSSSGTMRRFDAQNALDFSITGEPLHSLQSAERRQASRRPLRPSRASLPTLPSFIDVGDRRVPSSSSRVRLRRGGPGRLRPHDHRTQSSRRRRSGRRRSCPDHLRLSSSAFVPTTATSTTSSGAKIAAWSASPSGCASSTSTTPPPRRRSRFTSLPAKDPALPVLVCVLQLARHLRFDELELVDGPAHFRRTGTRPW